MMSFKDVTSRVNSFMTYWKIEEPEAALLAQAGFFSLQEPNLAMCYFCKHAFVSTIEGLIPKHNRCNPFCSRPNNQQDLSRDPLTPNFFINNDMERHAPTRVLQKLFTHCPTAKSGIAIRRHDLTCIIERMKSDAFAPIKFKQNDLILAGVGYFYNRRRYSVQCIFCSITHENFPRNQELWEHHAIHSPTCSHLIKYRGPFFIETVNRYETRVRTLQNRLIHSERRINKFLGELMGRCSICIHEVANKLYLPCGHIAACRNCDEQLNDSLKTGELTYLCPVCREPVQSTPTIFFPHHLCRKSMS